MTGDNLNNVRHSGDRTFCLTPWSRVLHEKLTVSQLLKKFYAILLSCLQEPTTAPCPEPGNMWNIKSVHLNTTGQKIETFIQA